MFPLLRLFLCLGTALCFPSASQALTLIQDGKPTAKIHAPKGDAVIDRAVGELNHHLQKMSGTTLEIAPLQEGEVPAGPAIVLGPAAVVLGAKPEKLTESREGFRLLLKGDQLLIGGQSSDAVLFGVYAFLEKFGCDWVMPGAIGEIIPARQTITIDALDESQAPDFLVRRLWYRGGRRSCSPEDFALMEGWLRRQKSGTYAPAMMQTGGHIWDQLIRLHKKDFEADPTMLALRRVADGSIRRSGPQIESTHPKVVDLFVADIKAAYEKNKWPKDQAAGFGIGPADGLGYSMSVESQLAGSGRLDPNTGAPDVTDLVILLGNEIQKRLEPEYPNVYLGFYSYSVHADYPARYQPHPRTSVIFAPITFSRYHSILDANSKSQVYYRGVVEEWGRLSKAQGNPLIYRGYNWNLAENLVPYSKLRIWGEELPFYKKMGVLGLNVEAVKLWSIMGPSDFLFMKMAWDTTLDWKAVLHDYCQKAFGAGSAPMERYFLRLTQVQSDAGQEAGSYHALHLIFNDAFVAEAERDLQAARTAAATPDDKTRVDYVARSVEALKLYLSYHRATMNFDFAAARAGYEAILAQQKATMEINPALTAVETAGYFTRFLDKFTAQAAQYSSGVYHIVHRLPDELPTMMDPSAAGDRMNFQSPALNDTGFLPTKTYSTTWDAQGLGAMRGGAVWYRHHFTLPADLKGQPVGLFIGSVDDEARVYLNGQLVGTSGPKFSAPSVFDLTEGLRDGDNLLALEVVRNGAANEQGTGGLMRPSYLFTGPRLESKAPKPLESRRVLPGGEQGGLEK